MKLRNKIMSVILSAVIAVGAFSAPVQESMGSAAVTAEAATSVAAPTAVLESGDYMLLADTGTIPLNCSTKNAKIYYSVNGSKYKLYKGGDGVPVTKNTTLKIYAKKNGVKSRTVTYKYGFAPQFTVAKAPGEYDSPFTLKFTSGCTGVKYYYTLDGSEPTTKSKRCYKTSGIDIDKTCTVRILGVKKGMLNSVFSGEYVISQSSSGDTVTSSDGKFSASPGNADILLNGKSYSVRVTKGRTSYQFVSDMFADDFFFFLKVNPSMYEKGDAFTLDDFKGNKNNLNMAIYGPGGSASTTSYSSYIQKLDITVERMDPDGIAAVSFDVRFKLDDDAEDGSITMKGLAVVDLSKEPESFDDDNGGNGGNSDGGSTGVPTYGSDRCMKCHGSGICPTCSGKRKWYYSNYGTDVDTTVTCAGCNGSGRCWGCGGSGKA